MAHKAVIVYPNGTFEFREYQLLPTEIFDQQDGFEHSHLYGLRGHKLGVFFEQQGADNLPAVRFAEMLLYPYTRSKADNKARGRVIFYGANVDLDAAKWTEIQEFVAKKRARGPEINARLAKKDKEINIGIASARQAGCDLNEPRFIRLFDVRARLDQGADAVQPTGLAAEVCHVCQTIGAKLRLCAKCKSVSYCGRDCQLEDWRLGGHRERCGKPTIERDRGQAKQVALDSAKEVLQKAGVALNNVNFERWRTERTKDIPVLADLMVLDLEPVGKERMDVIREIMRIGRRRLVLSVGDRNKQTFSHPDVRDMIVTLGKRLAAIGEDLQWVVDCDGLSFPEANRQELIQVWSNIRPLSTQPPRLNVVF